MTLRILHSSDLHGARGGYKALLAWDEPFDVWVDSGDFLPTAGRDKGIGGRIAPEVERTHQIKWLGYKQLASRLTAWLNGRPAIIVPGNHDFVSLYTALKQAGANAHLITPEGVQVAGLTWAGFREINWLDGEWQGETHDLSEQIEQTFASHPDILVTHTPPAGILDGHDGYGVTKLTTALTWQEHSIKAHLFGHAHEHGGQEQFEMGIHFINGAGHIKLIEVTV